MTEYIVTSSVCGGCDYRDVSLAFQISPRSANCAGLDLATAVKECGGDRCRFEELQQRSREGNPSTSLGETLLNSDKLLLISKGAENDN
ncbi:MAG: hypothetical protein WC796_04960 [Candidatus Pacearchaeota archaeon]|jgi:hypothetical protein